MWQRADLKKRAWEVLRKDYWKAFLISLVILFATGGGGGGYSGASGYNGGSTNSSNWSSSAANMDWAAIAAIAAIFVVVIGVFFVIAIGLQIFVKNPLLVGGRRYYVKTVQGLDNTKCFSFSFQKGNYGNIVKAMFRKDLQNILWYFVLIIPGIVKSFEYMMVPYILADNPNIGSKEAISVSRRMTDGSKFDIFVLGLSFLGWQLLGLLACCVGVLFVQPYVDATTAELYIDLRHFAMEKGVCHPSEFGMQRIEDDFTQAASDSSFDLTAWANTKAFPEAVNPAPEANPSETLTSSGMAPSAEKETPPDVVSVGDSIIIDHTQKPDNEDNQPAG